MNKKIDTTDLDVPVDDIDCWTRYPKHRWVYDFGRLLDSQSIPWSPFPDSAYDYEQANITLIKSDGTKISNGSVWTRKPQGSSVISEIYLAKGEIKKIRHIDSDSRKVLENAIGEIELKINAFVSIYFGKFTGVLSITTIGNSIFQASLRPLSYSSSSIPADLTKVVSRIYKKQVLILNGLTDRDLQESLTS
jgi:hypothetical protein